MKLNIFCCFFGDTKVEEFQDAAAIRSSLSSPGIVVDEKHERDRRKNPGKHKDSISKAARILGEEWLIYLTAPKSAADIAQKDESDITNQIQGLSK